MADLLLSTQSNQFNVINYETKIFTINDDSDLLRRKILWTDQPD